MSNCDFAGRSNDVKVKDIEGLKKSLEPFSHLRVLPNIGMEYR